MGVENTDPPFYSADELREWNPGWKPRLADDRFRRANTHVAVVMRAELCPFLSTPLLQVSAAAGSASAAAAVAAAADDGG